MESYVNHVEEVVLDQNAVRMEIIRVGDIDNWNKISSDLDHPFEMFGINTRTVMNNAIRTVHSASEFVDVLAEDDPEYYHSPDEWMAQYIEDSYKSDWKRFFPETPREAFNRYLSLESEREHRYRLATAQYEGAFESIQNHVSDPIIRGALGEILASAEGEMKDKIVRKLAFREKQSQMKAFEKMSENEQIDSLIRINQCHPEILGIIQKVLDDLMEDYILVPFKLGEPKYTYMYRSKIQYANAKSLDYQGIKNYDGVMVVLKEEFASHYFHSDWDDVYFNQIMEKIKPLMEKYQAHINHGRWTVHINDGGHAVNPSLIYTGMIRDILPKLTEDIREYYPADKAEEYLELLNNNNFEIVF